MLTFVKSRAQYISLQHMTEKHTMLSINEIKAQIETIKNDLKTQSKVVKKAEAAFDDSITKLQHFETRFSVIGYNLPMQKQKEHTMLVDCMTVEEQIQALRDGYKIASYVEGEVYFYKTIETTETLEQFETRINSDRLFHKQLIDTADAHKLNAALAQAEFKKIKQRLEQYVQLQRQYYSTAFGAK